MKTTNKFRHIARLAALPLALLSGSYQTQAKPGQTATAKDKPVQKGPAVKHAEEVLGKPLTPAQRTAVRAAQKERVEAFKPIQKKFRTTIAKVLGLTLAQYEAREKALREKNKGTH